MSYRKGLLLSFDLLSVVVKIDSAVEAEDSLTTVCVGKDGKTHVPTQINQVRKCKLCASEVAYADLKKAKKIGGEFQVVDQEEVASVKEAALGATKELLAITVHDAEVVRASTLQAKGVYFATPDGPGQSRIYSLLLNRVKAHPEKAFLVTFTPASRASLWQLKEFQGSLVFEQRVWPEQVVAAPSMVLEDCDPLHLSQLDQIITERETPFDLTLYRDTYAESLAELVASKEAVAGEAATTSKAKKAPTAVVVDLSAALDAMLKAKPKAKNTRAKKAA